LDPSASWHDKSAYAAAADKLGWLFDENAKRFAERKEAFPIAAE
jgi:ATP-dependent phosphoenolpyruvate carboxykinase